MKTLKTTTHGWHSALRELLRSANRDVLVCSPFVGQQGTAFVAENLSVGFGEHGRLTFLTNLSVVNVCQLATDPRAIRSLVQVHPQAVVFHIPGLHAKAYIADDRQAIVTSGNLTAGGLYRNLECGVLISDRGLVRELRSDLVEFANLGTTIPFPQLTTYCDALDKIIQSVEREDRTARQLLRQKFKDSLQPIEDDLLRSRLAGGPIHTVFARTIEYLLRTHGAMKTTQLHPIIASIHPNLCDDTVDRVINGERFGKKWKHAVRTAQQQLKKLNRIKYEDGVWLLCTAK